MAEQLRLLLEEQDEICSYLAENDVDLDSTRREEYEDHVRKLFFTFCKEDKHLSQRDFRDTQGAIGFLRGKIVSYGKYGSMYLSRRVRHSLEGFNLRGIPDLSRKLRYLIRKSSFPIQYTARNRSILSSLFSSLDFDAPLRVLVRSMINNIQNSWDGNYCSIYRATLEYVYCVFLSHSNHSTTLRVVGDSYKLLFDPESQDAIKDYPLYMYRQGTKMLPDGEEWIDDPLFKMVEDEPDIGFTFPWMYQVEDYKYSLEPSLFSGGQDKMDYFTFCGMDYLKGKATSRTIDLSKLSRYITDTAFYLPEVDIDKTVRKIDNVVFGDLVAEIKRPTIKKFEFLRKVIYVSQNNLRDTFIPSMKTFCALFVLESLCDQFIESCPEIRIGKMNHRLRFDTPWYVMIDIKKFGLTFPKEIIIATMNCIQRLTGCDLSLYIEAYRNYTINVNGDILRPERGFGLGNMNKLATIAHYIIAKQTGLDFYVYSDDIVFKSDREPSLEIFELLERLYNAFGLPLNKKKCYISRHWEFLGESSHEYSEQNETNKCTLLFKNAFFSRTAIEGELQEKAALRMYSSCRDLWLKNHEVHPILREDLLDYPCQMGGFVETSRPLNYCYEGGLQPSLYTSIKQPSKKFSYFQPDEYYQTYSQFDYYADKVIRNFHIADRKKRSKWDDLRFWKREEIRYKKAIIGYKSLFSLIKFGIDHLDLPDHLYTPRPARSQIKTYVRVPSIMRGGAIPSPYPIISVRQSDLECLRQLSYFTDLPVYTKFMLELKLGKGIMRLDIPDSWKGEVWKNELSLAQILIANPTEAYSHRLEEQTFEPVTFSEIVIDEIGEIRHFFEKDVIVISERHAPDLSLGFDLLDEVEKPLAEEILQSCSSTSSDEEEDGSFCNGLDLSEVEDDDLDMGFDSL